MLGMTEKLAQPTLDLPTAFDAWYLPRRPLCCDADYAQLRRRSRADALKHEHIETNPAALVNMLVVDIDAAEGRTRRGCWPRRSAARTWRGSSP